MCGLNVGRGGCVCVCGGGYALGVLEGVWDVPMVAAGLCGKGVIAVLGCVVIKVLVRVDGLAV